MVARDLPSGAEGKGFEPSSDPEAQNGFETHFIWLNHALSGPVRDTTRDSRSLCTAVISLTTRAGVNCLQSSSAHNRSSPRSRAQASSSPSAAGHRLLLEQSTSLVDSNSGQRVLVHVHPDPD